MSFEKNTERCEAVRGIVESYARRAHFGLDEQQADFAAHCVRYYGQGQRQGVHPATASTIGRYAPEYVLKSCIATRGNLNPEGERVLRNVCHVIEVAQETVWAALRDGELPAIDPVWITKIHRYRIHALVRALKDVSCHSMAAKHGSPGWLISGWALQNFRVETPLASTCVRQALRHAAIFGAAFDTPPVKPFPDEQLAAYWPEIAAELQPNPACPDEPAH